MKTPDFASFKSALTRRIKTPRVHCWELFVDHEVVADIIGKQFSKELRTEAPDTYVDRMLEFQLKMGYDYLPVFIEPNLPRDNFLFGADTADLTKGQRSWVDEHRGAITSMDQFEIYPWPRPADIDYSVLEAAMKKVPDGMKIMIWTSGVLEYVQWLMGYENMSYAIYDNPQLIDLLFEKIGRILTTIFAVSAEIPEVGLFAMGDDMGFKTSTLFAPEFLREYVFPRQKRCVDIGHARDIPFILHSCGNLETVMDDIIDYIGVDGKHSFEDAIMPVEKAYETYRERVTVVGGIDIDFLAKGSEEEVRGRVRKMLESASLKGSYIMGSGNSIANYIPVKNYLAMMEEAENFNFKNT